MKLRYPILLLLLVVLTSPAFGAVYTASDDPGPGEFSTIQAAVDLCSPTDSVEILGSFTENVVVNTTDLTFFGDGTVDGGTGDAFHFTPSADNIELSGFRISGIQVDAGSNGNWIYNNCFFAGNIIDNCVTPLINTWDGNYYYDHTATPTYAIAGGAQVDYNPAFATIAPVTSTATIAMGDPVVFDVDYNTNGICVGMPNEEIKVVEYTVTWDPAVLDFVSYEDGDGMPGNGQYLTDESGVAGGSLIVTATSLDDVMTEDGNLGHITFEAINVTCAATTTIAASGTAYTAAQTPNIVPVAFGSYAITVADDVIPVVDNFAANNPFGDDHYTSAADLEITTLEVSDDVDLYRTYFRFDDAGTWTSISELSNTAAPPPFVASDAITTAVATGGGSLADGLHKLNIMVRDQCGNDGFYDYEFTVDNTAPSFSFALSDDDGCAQAGYADGIVKVLTTGDGTEDDIDIAYRPNGSPTWTYTGWMAFAGSVDIDLTGMTDGAYDFAVRLKDVYDNESSWQNMVPGITLDQVSGTAVIDVPTSGTSLTVAWNATGSLVPDYVAHIITDDPAELADCTSPNWTSPWSATGSFDFTGDCGTKTLYIGIIDVAGNIVTASDDYIFDNCAPVVTAVTAEDQDGTTCSDSWTVDVTVEYTVDPFDAAAYVRFGMDGSTWSGWTALADLGATSETFAVDVSTLPGFVGAPTDCGDINVYAQLVDNLNNFSNTDVYGTFHRDCYDPTFTNMVQRDLDYPVDGDGVPINGNWSNETTVKLVFTGVVEDSDFDFVISEDAGFTAPTAINVADAVDLGGGEYEVEYTYVATIADGGSATLWAKLVTCADRESSVDSDALNFDFPTKAGAAINDFAAVSAVVNYLTGVAFDVDATDDFSGVYSMNIYEEGYTGTWGSFATPATVELADDGDGERTVGIYVADKAGNVTGPAMATVMVDTEGPAGVFDIVSTNPYAAAGYTNTSACTLEIDVPADAVSMYVRNFNPPTWGSWTAVPIVSAGDPQTESHTINFCCNMTFSKVQMRFFDDASNYTDVTDSIFVDVTPPGWFPIAANEGLFIGDGTHCDVLWGYWSQLGYEPMQFYMVKYLRWGSYPIYEGVAPAAPTMTTGFLAGTVDAIDGLNGWLNVFSMTDAIDPTEDIYSFAVFCFDSAGNYTVGDDTYWSDSRFSTSYLLGDLDFDGKISFMTADDGESVGDFARFANAYYASDTDPYWDDACDFADHFDDFPYPEPDDIVDIYDLMDFVLNYTDYHEGVSYLGGGGLYDISGMGIAKVVPHDPVAIKVEYPDRLAAGEEVTLTLNMDNTSEIMGLHLLLDISDQVEIVSVNQGDMFNTTEKTFFYKNTTGSELMIDGAIFSKDGFAANEIAEVTLRAKTDIVNFEINDLSLLVRDANNQDVEVSFNTTVQKVTPIPTEFALSQNYPNPFNPTTTIKLALPVATNYTLEIFNIAGQKVTTFSGFSEAGTVTFNWDASDQASGVYFYRAQADDFKATKKMVMIK